jgi:hypothetical protein
MRSDRRADLAYEPNSTIENVIFLESAFEIHARLLCCLEYRLHRCVSEGRMLPSKSRQFQDLAQKRSCWKPPNKCSLPEGFHALIINTARLPVPAQSGAPGRGALLTDPSRGLGS